MNYYRCRSGCSCHKCYKQPTNPSNKTVVVPVSGVSAYEAFLAYNPDLDPNLNPESPWTESYWLENWVKTNLNYEDFEI